MPTTALRGGMVIDGTGSPAFPGHVLIEGDRIKAVARENEPLGQVDKFVEAAGCAIAPGFIDMHSHMDWSLPLEDHASYLKCLLEQGITTVVAGNCGFSPAPVSSEKLGLLERDFMLPVEKPLDYSWRSMGGFLQKVQERRPIVNLAQLVGHATIRAAATDTGRGALRAHDLRYCLEKLRQALDEGACGLSFGLGYDPGMYSPMEEIEAFCSVAAEARKPVTVHLRTYSKLSTAYSLTYTKPHNLRALQEMLHIARRTQIVLQVSHLMVAFRITWPLVDDCIKLIEDSRKGGVDVMMDALPYSDLNGSIATLLPPWFTARVPGAYRSWWARTRIKAENAVGFRRVGYPYAQKCLLMDAGVAEHDDMNGSTIAEIARRWKASPSMALIRLAELSGGHAAVLCRAVAGEPGNEKQIDTILSHDLCLFETDALVRSRGYPHPAALGAFPRILGYYVRQRKLFSLENAVRRMAAASADRFGIRDRGSLQAGKAADVVVFDPQAIGENPDVDGKPAGRPVGIHHVFLNGVHVVRDGNWVAGARAGKVLGL